MKTQYRENVGSIIRGLLNGVKHTAQTFATANGLDANQLEAIMNGSRPLTPDVEEALLRHPGINQKYFYPPEVWDAFPVVDDTTDGVLTVSFEKTKNTERTVSRGPEKTPYYVYADTALSNLSLFRPEWIKMLYAHTGETPDIPDWAFNKGHFEDQVTYFIGPVNFYWIDESGNKRVCQMHTGDMNYITPFVPHSFTTREAGRGFILAVTYGGAVATDQFQSKIKSWELSQYIRNIEQQLPEIGQTLLDEHHGVLFKKRSEDGVIIDGRYRIRSLMRDIPYQRETRAFEYIVTIDRSEKKLDIQTSSEKWAYNIGDTAVILLWGKDRRAEIEPGGSFLIQPDVPHAFRIDHDGEAKLLVIEITSGIGNPLEELALIRRYARGDGVARVHTETTQWY